MLCDYYHPELPTEFPALVHQFGENFEPRMKIDRKWNEVLDWDYDDEGLKALDNQIQSALKDMKKMMEQN